MKTTADAVVIGGGIAGASTLYYLARMGLREAVLLEKGDLASGSTGDSAAMVRQQYSNEVSIRLVRESLRFFQGFADEFDGARVFNGIGWLFLCEPDAREAFGENMARLKRLGVRTWEISPEDASEELPGLNTDGIGPRGLRAGLRLRRPAWNRERARPEGRDPRRRGLHAYGPRPAWSWRAAGYPAWSPPPVPSPHPLSSTPPAPGPGGRQMGRPQPATGAVAGAGRGYQDPGEHARPAPRSLQHVRPHLLPPGGRWAAAGRRGHPKENEPVDPDCYHSEADADFVEDVTGRPERRLPGLAGAEVVSSWAGLYTITPDWNMMVGPASGVDGLYLRSAAADTRSSSARRSAGALPSSSPRGEPVR